MNFLICGLGSIGSRHLKILRELGDFGLWAYRTGKATIGSSHQKEASPDRVFNDLELALDAKPDAVLITNPTFLHLDVAISVAARGISLFIEKPLDCNLEKVNGLQQQVSEKLIPVLVGFNMMFHPAILKIIELLENQTIGEITSSISHWGTYLPGWHPWEDYKQNYAARSDMGGGVVLTMCHELNYLTDFFGKVLHVKAMETQKRTLGITGEEGVNILLGHETGVISNVHLNYTQKPYRRTCEIIGEKGTLFWDYMKPEIIIENDESRQIYHLDGDSDTLLDQSYQKQMSHFVAMIEKRAASRIPLEKGIDDLTLCLNILQEIRR